jgi:hypothetical protein
MLQMLGPDKGGRGGRSSSVFESEVERRGSCFTQEVWLDEGDQDEEAGSWLRFRAKGAADGIGEGLADGDEEG